MKGKVIIYSYPNTIYMYDLRNTAICFFVLFFFMPCYVLAQGNFSGDFEKRKNKAVSELKNFPHQDTGRVNALIRVLKKASFMKQMKQVMPYYDEALAISRKINYVKGLAECYRFMGSFYKSSMDQPNAQIYFDSVIQTARNSKDTAILEVKAVAQRWKGMIYYDQENYYEALNYLFESLKHYESDAGNMPIFLYQTITQIYIRLNNFEQASFYAKKYGAC